GRGGVRGLFWRPAGELRTCAVGRRALSRHERVGPRQSDLARLYRDRALRTESYNLSHGGARRVYAATVSPGYDDSRLGRDTSSVIDRANGAFYDTQWRAAVSAGPDWMLITSWNEFWENTHIEPSVRYQKQYQVRTRMWSELFHSISPPDARRAQAVSADPLGRQPAILVGGANSPR